MALTIGVDVGGTKILAGTVDDAGEIIATERLSTPARNPQAAIDAITSVIERLRDGSSDEVVAVGIGVAALVDDRRRDVVFAPNLGWPLVPLADHITQETGLPAVVENDANAAAWGEFTRGAGRSMDDVIVITVGTGIGGGLILGGRLRRGAFGMAAEVGHMTMVPGGHHCGCGRQGCWEQYASGSALVRHARELAVDRREQAHILLSLGDGSPEGIRGRDVTEAARQGDPVARAAFTDVGRWLGRGLADLTAVLDPAAYIIGGGVSDAGPLLVDPAVDEHAAIVRAYGDRPVPDVVGAELGNTAGLVGAAMLARELVDPF